MNQKIDQNAFKKLPKMDRLMAVPEIAAAGEALPRALFRETLQGVLDALRASLLSGEALPEDSALYARCTEALRLAGRYHLRRVVNATGVVLHTNLGRAPLGEKIAGHVADVAAGYSNLEYDLTGGARGSRYDCIESLLCRLTGAEAAMVVGNNAAAVFLMLNTLAEGKAVAVSRGELVEIGGAFRVPEIMKRSGAELMEIGTTNKTHLYDYENAIAGGAAAVLKVHTSNFKILGFTEQADIESLGKLTKEQGIPLLYDVGSGFLLPPSSPKLRMEGPDIPAAVKSADLVCFSGDKLLGGSQAGILAGKKEFISAIKKNQLNRMLRPDKLTLAALEAVLRLLLDPAAATEALPVLSMLEAAPETLLNKAEALSALLKEARGDMVFDVVPCEDEPGGGSLPDVKLPGYAVSLSHPSFSPDALEQMLRTGEPPVIARISKDRLLLSVRTLLPGDGEILLERVKAIPAI